MVVYLRTLNGNTMINDIIKDLQNFHAEIDNKVNSLEKIHLDRIKCKAGCSSCCVDEITVFEIEAENIKQNYPDLLENEMPNKIGKCAFLDKNENCRIYPHRPYVCRTQGLPLSWIEELEDGNLVEMRDICPINDNSSPIEEIDSEKCWIIGPSEQKLFQLQNKFKNNSFERIYLRNLFKKA